MAQLNDTMVQGDLRVTGKIYGTDNAIHLENANLAIPMLGNGDYVGSSGDFFIGSGSGKNLPDTTNNFNIHTTVAHFSGTTYRLSQIATPTSSSNPTGIYERGGVSTDGITWTFGGWLAVANSSHSHGNITTDGKIGSTANLPVVTGTSGAVTTGSWATSAADTGSSSSAGTANTFSRGDHTHKVAVATGDSAGQVKIAGQNASVNGWANKANLASPTFTGTPAAPTATAGTNTTQIATTAFVQTAVGNKLNSSGFVCGYCSTAAGTAQKDVTATNYSASTGNVIMVRFTNTNSAAGQIKLNAGGKNYPIVWNGTLTASGSTYALPAGTWPCYFDGAYWNIWTTGAYQFQKIYAKDIATDNTIVVGSTSPTYTELRDKLWNGQVTTYYARTLIGASSEILYMPLLHMPNSSSMDVGTIGFGTLHNGIFFYATYGVGNVWSSNTINILSPSSIEAGTDITVSTFGGTVTIGVDTTGTASGTNAFVEGNGTQASGNYSHAEGESSKATQSTAHAEGYNTTASGYNAHAEGNGTTASSGSTHAEGNGTKATSDSAHAEGRASEANGAHSHAEGYSTKANGIGSHAEGSLTKTFGVSAHSEGGGTAAVGKDSHAEGLNSTDACKVGTLSEAHTSQSSNTWHINGVNVSTTDVLVIPTSNGNKFISGILDILGGEIVTKKDLNETVAAGTSIIVISQGSAGDYSHSEGKYTFAYGEESHAEGYNTKAIGNNSHAEGELTQATEIGSHAEGYNSAAHGDYSHAEGNNTYANGKSSHSEGKNTWANYEASHAEGQASYANNIASHAEGDSTYANGLSSHSEGKNTSANAAYSHAEGQDTVASEACSHAEGYSTGAHGNNAHTEGYKTLATSSAAHAEGSETSAYFDSSHAEGRSSVCHAQQSHAEGFSTIAAAASAHSEGSYSTTVGVSSHAEGGVTIAGGKDAHAEGFNNDVLTTKTKAASSSGITTIDVETVTGIPTGMPWVVIPNIHFCSRLKRTMGTGGKTLELYDSLPDDVDTNSTVIITNSGAFGQASHTEGLSTRADDEAMHAAGKYNATFSGLARVTGWGTLSIRKDIEKLDTSGNLTLAGNIYANGNQQVSVSGHTHSASNITSGTFATARIPDLSANKITAGKFQGKVTLLADQYNDSLTAGALDANNSNIVKVNAIYTADTSDNASEGIHFYRDSTHVDTLWMNGGKLLFVPNRAIGTSTSVADSNRVLYASSGSNPFITANSDGVVSRWTAAEFMGNNGLRMGYSTTDPEASTTKACSMIIFRSAGDHTINVKSLQVGRVYFVGVGKGCFSGANGSEVSIKLYNDYGANVNLYVTESSTGTVVLQNTRSYILGAFRSPADNYYFGYTFIIARESNDGINILAAGYN